MSRPLPRLKRGASTSVANSKTRIDGYIFLSKSEDLLDPKVDISKDIVDKDEDHDYYKVDQLKINTINDGEHDYNHYFQTILL